MKELVLKIIQQVKRCRETGSVSQPVKVQPVEAGDRDMIPLIASGYQIQVTEVLPTPNTWEQTIGANPNRFHISFSLATLTSKRNGFRPGSAGVNPFAGFSIGPVGNLFFDFEKFSSLVTVEWWHYVDSTNPITVTEVIRV